MSKDNSGLKYPTTEPPSLIASALLGQQAYTATDNSAAFIESTHKLWQEFSHFSGEECWVPGRKAVIWACENWNQ